MLHCTPSVCQQVWPRWSAPCWCWFHYSKHTCEGLSSFFKTIDSPSVPQEVKKQFTCTLVEHDAIIPGTSPNMWWSAAPQECYVHQKLNLHITSWFWSGLLRQQQSSGSTPGIFECTHQSLLFWNWLCIKVSGCTFEHLVSIGNKLQLFLKYFSGFAWFPALVRHNLMVRGAARMHDQLIVVWQYIFVLVCRITSWRLGMEFFCTLYMLTTRWSITETERRVKGDSLVRAKRNKKQEIWKMWKAKHPYLGSQGQKVKRRGPSKAKVSSQKTESVEPLKQKIQFDKQTCALYIVYCIFWYYQKTECQFRQKNGSLKGQEKS